MRYLVQLCLVVGALTGDPTLVRSKPDDTVSVATQIEILRQHDRHLEDSTKSQFDLIKWAIGLFGGLFGAFVGLGTFLFERRYRHDRAELLRESKVHIEATIAAAEKNTTDTVLETLSSRLDERIASLSAQLSKLAADLVATEIELKVLRAETIARENPGQALRAWTEILKQCIKSKHWRVDHALEEIERILPRVLASGGLGSMEEGQLALTLQLLPERYETRKMRLQTQLRSDPGDAAR